MRRLGKHHLYAHLCTCLSFVSGWLKHYVFVTFTLHFIFCLHTGSLASRDTSARVREESQRSFSDIFPCLQLSCWFAARVLVLMS